MIKKNDLYEVTITEINPLGFGVCKIDGMVVFVAQGAPGDHARIRIIKCARTYAIGKIEEVLSPSVHRIVPHCPVSARCGGCVYAHVDYTYEAESKRNAVKAALRKAGLPEITVHPLISPSPIDGYRNKAQMPFAPDGGLGYYAPKSHRVIVPPGGCALLPPIFRQIAETVTDWVREYSLPVYREEDGTGLLRHLYLRRGTVTGEVMVCLVINGTELPHADTLCERLTENFPQVRTVVLNHNTARTNVILGDRCTALYGDGRITDQLCGSSFEISPLSFYQINHATAQAIYKKAISLADLKATDTLADLFCGIGTIGLSAARHSPVGRVIGVEIVPEAIENAKRNAQRNGISNAGFYCGDANHERISDCNVMIVDPPRKGLSTGLIERIAGIFPDRLVYISCAPDTLARNLSIFAAHGYRTHEVFPYDMFPRTAHVETVCLLSKLNVKQHIEVELTMDEMDLTAAEKKASYEEIKAYVLEKFGMKVSHLYIAQVKRKCGIIERENYNKPKSENAKQPQCPPEKEAAIIEALKYFRMIES